MCGELREARRLPAWAFPLWSRLKAAISPALHRQRGWALPGFGPQRSRQICPSSPRPCFSEGLFCACPAGRHFKGESLLGCLCVLGLVPVRADSGCDKCSCHVSAHVLLEPLCFLSAMWASHPSITSLLLSFASCRRMSAKFPDSAPVSPKHSAIWNDCKLFNLKSEKNTRLYFADFCMWPNCPPRSE